MNMPSSKIQQGADATWSPSFGLVQGSGQDLVLCSNDGVCFAVYSSDIDSISPGTLQALIAASPSALSMPIPVAESSAVIHVLLHAIYGTSCAENTPSAQELIEAVDKMLQYGMVPANFVFLGSPLYQVLLSHSPYFPLEIYALAGHHTLWDLAKATSPHLLAYPLYTIDDSTAERMTPAFLNRLLQLHLLRLQTLRKILLTPPTPHASTLLCDDASARGPVEAWAWGAASLTWGAAPCETFHRDTASS